MNKNKNKNKNNITVTFLGSGTSHGVPMIGCECSTCLSTDPKDKRLNASIMITVNNKNILIDCGRDFRQQALKSKIKRIDHILITHIHFDHIGGIDDLRVFNDKNNSIIPIYGKKQDLDYLKKYTYHYLFDKDMQIGGGLSKIKLIPLKDKITIEGIDFEVIPVLHGNLLCYGYKFLNSAYISDVSLIPEESLLKLKNLDTLILDALRFKPHSTHFNLKRALKVVELLKPKKTYFTHICHDLAHNATEQLLKDPKSAYYSKYEKKLSYDGLIINLQYTKNRLDY